MRKISSSARSAGCGGKRAAPEKLAPSLRWAPARRVAEKLAPSLRWVQGKIRFDRHRRLDFSQKIRHNKIACKKKSCHLRNSSRKQADGLIQLITFCIKAVGRQSIAVVVMQTENIRIFEQQLTAAHFGNVFDYMGFHVSIGIQHIEFVGV